MPRIDDHIQRAIEEGKFDDLPGKGKPLHLDETPLEDPDWRLAHHMLREAGYSLPWIELRKEIEAEIEAIRVELRQAWEWRQTALAEKQPYERVEEEWQRAVKAFGEKVEGINKKIFDFNLQAPAERVQIRKLEVEREVPKSS